MIKAEVVFDGDKIMCNGYEVEVDTNLYHFVYKDGRKIKDFSFLDEAIRYCLEN